MIVSRGIYLSSTVASSAMVVSRNIKQTTTTTTIRSVVPNNLQFHILKGIFLWIRALKSRKPTSCWKNRSYYCRSSNTTKKLRTVHSRYSDQLHSDHSRYSDQRVDYFDWSLYRSSVAAISQVPCIYKIIDCFQRWYIELGQIPIVVHLKRSIGARSRIERVLQQNSNNVQRAISFYFMFNFLSFNFLVFPLC